MLRPTSAFSGIVLLNVAVLLFGCRSLFSQEIPNAVTPKVNSKPRVGIDAKAVAAVIDQIIDAARKNDSATVSTFVDANRLFREIERQQLLVALQPAEKLAMRMTLASTIGTTLLEELNTFDTRVARVHLIRFAENGGDDIVAIVRLLDKRDRQGPLIRFWLTREGNQWKVFDWEESESLFRSSSRIGAWTAIFCGQPGSDELQRLLLAARDAASGDMTRAEQILGDSSETPLVDRFESSRMALYSQIKFAQGDYLMAQRCFDAAVAGDPEILLAPKILSALYAAKGDHAQSLEQARRGVKELGPDPQFYVRIGDALAHLNNPNEAAIAYRTGLDIDPNSVVNFLGLAAVLTGDQKRELAARFSSFDDPATRADEIASGLRQASDGVALAILTDEFSKQGVDKGLVAFYQAVANGLNKRFDVAAKQFQELRDKSNNPSKKAFFQAHAIEALMSAGKPLEAYRGAIDKRVAFQMVADRLLSEEKAQDLLAIAAEYEKEQPGDIRTYLYKGGAYYSKKEYVKADQELAKGMALAETEQVRERFRQFRVMAMYQAGEWASAYKSIPSSVVTFRQLASLLLQDGKGEDLQRLVSMHRVNVPGDHSLDQWEAEAAVLQKDYDTASKLLLTSIDMASENDQKSRLIDRFLDIQIRAGKPLDGYLKSPQPGYSFAFLADRLLAAEDPDGLLKVLQEHRRRSEKAGAATDAMARIDYYEGRAFSLKKDYQSAEASFARGMSSAGGTDVANQCRQGRIIALAQLGQAKLAYEQIEPKVQTFDELARFLAREKKAADLKAIVDAHAKEYPQDPTLGLWTAEVHWINLDYLKVVQVLLERRPSILSDEANRPRFEDRIIRSLVRLSRIEEAQREARISTSRDEDPWFEAVVAVTSGNVDDARNLLKRCIQRGYSNKDFYADEDMGAQLKSKRMSQLAVEFPE